MISGRTLLVLAVAAASWWLWRSGEWQSLTTRLSMMLDPVTGTIDGPPPVNQRPAALPAENGPATAPGEIRTWIDAQGVRHFASAPLAPPGSTAHEGKPATILKDYDQPLRQNPAHAKADAEAGGNDRHTPADPDATTAVYELKDNLEKRLEAIRQENNR